MIVGLSLIMGLAVAWTLGADLTRLAGLQFRGSWLVFGSLAIQIGIYTALTEYVPTGWDKPLHIASYLMLIGFFVLNLRVRAFWVVGFGLLANVAVIFANSGQMPVSAEAWKSTGRSLSAFNPQGISDNNVLANSHTHLRWLSDVFAIPSQVPFASVLSIGDFLIVLGMVAFVYRACVPSSGRNSVHVFAPLRSGAFRRVIAGRLVSNIGDWLTQAAVVTWIYSSSRSVGLVSLFLVARMLSYAVGGLASAPILDRLPAFTTLSMVETLRGGLALAMIPFAAAGQVWPVVALAAMSSFLSAATSPTAQGLIPDVLPSHQLQAGNAIHQMARSLTSVIGSLIGGFAVAEFNIQTALAIDLVTFCAAALLYRRYAHRGGQASQAHAGPGTRVSRRDLLRTILTSRVVFGLTASFTLVTGAIGIMNSDSSKVFDDQLGNAHAYGYILAVVSIGYVCSELLTGYMRRQSVARRSIGLSFLATGGTMFVLSHATTVPIAYLALFLFGASDGITEVVRDSLIQLKTQRYQRSGVFAIVNSVQTTGMVVGLGIAPLIADRFTTGTTLRIVAVGCVLSAIVAGVSLVGGRGDNELLHEDADPAEPLSGDLGAAVVPFELRDRSHQPVTLGDLTAAGPLVLVLAGADGGDEACLTMMRETAAQLPPGCRLAVVSRRDSKLARRADAVRMADWLRDPSGDAFRALRVAQGRRTRDAGVFVIDHGGVLRFAFRTADGGDWIPASFVVSRLRRLVPDQPQVRVVRTELSTALGSLQPASDPV